jgi:hypothetical protein
MRLDAGDGRAVALPLEGERPRASATLPLDTLHRAAANPPARRRSDRGLPVGCRRRNAIRVASFARARRPIVATARARWRRRGSADRRPRLEASP